MAFERVAVLGLGKVGLLAATLLHEAGFDVVGIDTRPPRHELPFPSRVADMASAGEVRGVLGDAQAVLSCLPYHLNLALAEIAHELGLHYFDLTEDVPTTKAIIEMSASARGIMAPQCGLAPGFVGIVAASQIASFDRCRSSRLRVGALPQHPTGLLGYAFNWSPEGVVNEYLNDCEVIADGHKKLVPALEQLETILIDGLRLEAFTTSGGLGTMCDTYLGKVRDLNYKTMRFPGHCELMRFFFHELHMKERREEAGRILVNAKPPVDDDVVYVHAAVEGTKGGALARDEFVRAYPAKVIGGKPWRAISWTTAGSVAAVVEMVAAGDLPQQGFLKQEEIRLDLFLKTRNGGLYAG